MKKIFSILAIAALMAGCSKEDSTTDVAPATFTLTGYTSNDTRTEFGEPYEANTDDWRIPFIWSEGDKIWSGNQQSNAAVINGDGSASFTFASEPANTIYYNMTGTSATQANVPATQSIANNLGQNGDFGYATVEDGTFTLSHATAYLWFNTTTTIDNATLKTITINADGVNIAGKATWSGSSFGAVSEGKSEVTLTVNQPLSSTNGNVWAMVVLPADLSGKKIKVTYELSIGGNTKYHIQTLNGKNIEAGKTQKISTNITNENIQAYRELRVLTFEDDDAKFTPYTLDYCSTTINKWSDLIDPQQNNGDLLYSLSMSDEDKYRWSDDNNTWIKSELLGGMYGTSFFSGGHAISNYTSVSIDDVNTAYINGVDSYAVYDAAQLSIPCASGHSGNNFAIAFHDSQVEYDVEILPLIEFSDGKARVVDHMWVTNTTYVYNQLQAAGFGSTYVLGDESTYKIVAYGYDSFDEGAEPIASTEFYLLEKGKKFVTEWTKWDLSSLGEVVKVAFNLVGSEDMMGDYGLSVPGYFAYDDVAVRFKIED